MADMIKCSVCGENNPADNEFCKNCQSRLQSLSGPSKGDNAPLQAGQVPTKKVTSEGDFSETLADDKSSAPSTLTWMTPQESAPEKDGLAFWLAETGQSPASFSDETAAPVQPAASTPEASSSNADKSDWLHDLQSGASTFDETPVDQTPISSDERPDWLKNMDAGAASFEQKPVEQPVSQSQSAPASDVPDWLRTFGEPPAPSTPSAPAAPSGEMPQVVQPLEPADVGISPAVDMPDWLSSPEPDESEPQPQESGQASSAAPAFADGSLSSGDVDAIFGSLQMPDWLSSAAAPSQPLASESPPPAAQSGASIAPADLPSWVQAMRPVEATLLDTNSGESVDSVVEMNGPLAGLQGVLPAMPGGMKPSYRPESHSIKLNASEEQLAHSALLEQILAEETTPVPMKSPSTILSQRVLRWVITAFLFLFVGGIFFAKTEIFALPSRGQLLNDETEATISVMDSIPEGAPVLVVFDYEPSLAGELEAVGAPLFNRLLLLKHPNLAIVSTSPTGSALAERFMSTTLKGRNYQRDVQYVDLGYLAGGLAGVYDFAQNPTKVMPFGADGSAVWNSSVLQGKTRLAEFSAVIVLTDSAEAGRVWIEQAGPFRGNASFVVISSAQAGPMLMPYLQSAQINGLVAGLNSAAKVEQANGQPGLARRYWDAYSLGLLVAVAFMFLGGLWNFFLGLQARRAQEAK